MQGFRRSRRARTETGQLTAVLGPTNTGKTHLAVERMLGHQSGMIGCPLRLLAREIYDRAVRTRGAGQVALVTGEERIVPARPRYFVCTVESMPLERAVEFLAVDEIQLIADPERGHVFTDRLLNARGLSETMFLGAATAAPMLRRLLPAAELVSRPRFSKLDYAGSRKLTRLPARTAVVAFSATEVYQIAELLRRFRGGAAVVMGALSPRTRNAQVGLYQAGEVDYLVATDAIGMGLNMNVDHVAFARLDKFDGREGRPLTAAEIAQIAGRAGRHTRDGSFGTTHDAGPLDAALVAAVEEHRFEPITRIYWRNGQLDFASLGALIRSLDTPPPLDELIRPREADDLASLRALAAMPDIARLARGWDAVALLWDVCCIPDFRQTMAEAHVRLLADIYRHLMGPSSLLPAAWVQRLVDRLDHTDGDIDTLAMRIAHIRTWNYVGHRPGWVADPAALQDRARDIEDRLSDALHDRLTQRFVDRRTTVLQRRLKQQRALVAAVKRSGEVVVEGEHVGRLDGFDFVPDDAAAWSRARVLRAAVRRALEPEMRRRAGALEAAANEAFALGPDGSLRWQGATVARLVAGAALAAPGLALTVGDLVEEPLRRRIEKRLGAWLRWHVGERFAPLTRAREAPLAGPARGLAFQLAEALGSVPRANVAEQIAALDARARKDIARLGIRLGRESAFMPAMLKPRPVALRALLWCVAERMRPVAPPAGQVSLALDPALPERFYAAIGYRVLGARALRVDMVERLAGELRRRARTGPVTPDAALLNLAGCAGEGFAGVVAGLGFKALPVAADGAVAYVPMRAPRREAAGSRPRPPRRRGPDGESPFAALAALKRRRR
ncbi:MAG TPA: helicase-related protein [Alphaproteobacteria bacterium]